MRRSFGFALVAALALGLGVSRAAMHGGHGGGHHGGHHSGHRGHRGHHAHRGHAQHHRSHHAHHHAHWANHNRPFSRGWYGRHRRAWGGGWGWGNPWAVADWGTTAGWLGLGAGQAPVWGGYGPAGTTIYESDNESAAEPAVGTPAPPTPSPESLVEETAAARALAAKGADEPAQGEKFLPLGVFTVAPQDQTEASAMMQLAVSPQGVLRGTYIDLLSDEEQPIRGRVDKASQTAAWTFGAQGKVTFRTALPVLTEPSGPVSVHYENGQTRPWVLARYDKEPSDNDPDDDESGDEDDDADDGDGDPAPAAGKAK
jgi:hypothetical protein